MLLSSMWLSNQNHIITFQVLVLTPVIDHSQVGTVSQKRRFTNQWVGFINPGSLMDLLHSKSSQIPNDRPQGRSNLRPEGLAEEERRPFLTPARLSDRKASLPTTARLSDRKVWPNAASNSNPRLPPGMHRTSA